MSNWINYPFIFILAIGLFVLLLTDSRRLVMIAMGIVLIMSFVVNIQFWSFTFALSKFITGIMAGLILNLTPETISQSIFGKSRMGQVFRGTALAFGFALIIFISKKASVFLSIDQELILTSMFIMVCGLIQLGISQNPYRVFLGLIILFLGFEILYGSLENSLLINGMFAAVDLLIALVGSYLITNSLEEEVEE